MWAWWVLGGLVLWFLVSAVVALVVGAMIRLADRRESRVPVDAAALTGTSAAAAAAPRIRRRAVPLPPLGVALAATAVALETAGFLLRLSGSSGAATHILSMDAPFSLPRMFVAGLFAAAALAAVAGAGLQPGRRVWWTALGLVAGSVAAVKAGSTVHAEAVTALGASIGAVGAVLVSGAVAAAVVAALWFLSRTERRDRARVLGSLAFYAVAAVGLSALSSAVAGATGGASSWTAGATFVEESGEALAGVSLLIAVLVGVAPKLALPAGWALRRVADEQSLELPELSAAPGVRETRG